MAIKGRTACLATARQDRGTAVSLQFRQQQRRCISRVHRRSPYDEPHSPRVRDNIADKFSSSRIVSFRLCVLTSGSRRSARLHPVLMPGVASCLKMGTPSARLRALLKGKYGQLRSVYIRPGSTYIWRINSPSVQRNGAR